MKQTNKGMNMSSHGHYGRLGSTFLFVLVSGLFSQQAGADYKVRKAFPNLKFEAPVEIQNVPSKPVAPINPSVPRMPDLSDYLFVVQQAGTILYFNKKIATTADLKTFLDIETKVDYGGEKGLLGLAFHPQFNTNGLFYVNYTAPNPLRTVIARFKATEKSGKISVGDFTVMLEINQPYSNHNGGKIAFGKDGYLYIGMGDGGSANDPEKRGQNLKDLLGKILRIDVNNKANNKEYAIPQDNPFVALAKQAKALPEIYAYGIRNPWRFSFDTLTGKLWLADVGQNAWEEIDIIRKGGNYGWNIIEGNACLAPGCNPQGFDAPVLVYDHSQGQSITGGYVYRGNRLSGLKGNYIYGDFITGKIWSLTVNNSNKAVNNKLLVDSDVNISTFGIDANNELYFAAFDGFLYTLDP